MATRTIVTSQPDVACSVCERRLLRGEQWEVFLDGGRPRTVCELCAPRAVHAGWLREIDGDVLSVTPARARRGRNLFDRLRQVGRGAQASLPNGAELSSRESLEPTDAPPERARSRPVRAHTDAPPARARAPLSHTDAPPAEADAALTRSGPDADAAGDTEAAGVPVANVLDRAVEVFNAGGYPRRVAGVARSLGPPGVNVHPLEGVPNVVEIVVAWELCWYRYRVDLDETPVDARARDQGTHMSELSREDRLVNAAVDERGAVSLS
jgi:hypothetical protein